MKKNLLLLLLIVLISGQTSKVSAQRYMKAFEHISLGTTVGTTGFGLDIATPLSPNFALRAGYSALPFSYKRDYDVDSFDENLNTNATVELKGELGLKNGKLLVDYFPFKRSGFHITGGFYAGKEKFLTVSGASDQSIEFDEYVIHPVDGIITAGLKIRTLKPYFGLGFGRSIPSRRIGFKFEIGTMYQGKPEVFSTDPNFTSTINSEIKSHGFDYILDFARMYPVVNFNVFVRLTGGKRSIE